MHPPEFSIHDRLANWPDYTIEIRCAPCGGRSVVQPVRLWVDQHGGRTFAEILAKLRCKQCGARAAPVYLVAGLHRTHANGPAPCWAVELVPTPETAEPIKHVTKS